MKALVNTAPGCLELQECDPPAPGPGQVRIRTAACGICATDLEMIAGWARVNKPGEGEPQGQQEADGFPDGSRA